MADPHFFKKSGSFTIDEIMREFPCTVFPDDADRSMQIEDLSSLKEAEKNHLSFFDNAKYKGDFKNTSAGACFVSPKMLEYAPDGLICLVTETPYKAYALTAQKFYPQDYPEASISEQAFIHDTATIGDSCVVEAGAYIGKNVQIGERCWIEANAVIRENVTIGKSCHIGAGASVSHAVISDHVRLYPGVRIGQDGFGFAIDPAGHVKVPQLGRVIIESHVEIGANTTIDRGAGPDTVIGQGTWIDNLVQIGHNVQIGRGCVIVAQVGISGSTVIEDFVAIGGQVGIAGHLTVGSASQIAAQSGVMNDIPAGQTYMGSPAFPQREFLKQIAALKRLIKKPKSD